ncbi:fungal-specific transcription factor domain-containing protein [Penicillium riverlandense]|uniref:fungal-specific transcription factor domain-containing protein n=1 Tax=Penicillium riverlandense TaxID=1903569 RepID=UPI0025477A83|nr:fungal-specific transcription factor domain-containing protein [Penicillium riverlandense]KAJ5814578.1 fungal-specific transcription factor domain-containing protein [Penicillium riverlandense]
MPQVPINESILPMPLQFQSGSMNNMAVPVSPPNSTSLDRQTPKISGHEESSTCDTQITPLPSLFPLEAGDTWRNQGSPQPALWDYRLDQEWETLLTGDDFDLDAVNLSLLHATSDFVPAIESIPEPSLLPPREQSVPDTGNDLVKGRANAIQRKWHTFSEPFSSGQMTPDVSQEGSFIDESYRKRLVERLQPRVQHGILPSTPFLDLCIQAYFSKFHPLFPVVHMPTFRPGTQNSVLLLSICSAGSLFVGSTRAITHGISMFERLNKAILASWDTYVSKPGSSSLISLQAVLIAQTFGLLLGRPKDLAGIEMWHGSIVSWARKAKLFHPEPSECNILDLSGEALENAWMDWIQTEVKKRIVVGLHIHDAEFARLYHHEPFLRHSLNRLPQISSNELFTAPNSLHWKTLVLETQRTLDNTAIPGDFALSGMLESISALACEHREANTAWPSSPTSTTNCHDLLTTWYTQFHRSQQGKPSWLCLMMLWHSVFILLHADIDALECACGRDGADAAQRRRAYALSWLRSADAKRCLLHALLIQKNFESLPAGAESSIHVPMCLYYCGIVWSCFMCFAGDAEAGGNPVTVEAADTLHFAELLLPGVDGMGFFADQTRGLSPRRLATGSLFRIIDLLNRISHWKIAQSLASTLLALVEETQDLF